MKSSAGELARWLPLLAVSGIAGLYLAVLLPPISGTYSSDDAILLIPKILEDLHTSSAAETLRYLFAPHEHLPSGPWKLYLLGTLSTLGPSNVGLLHVGLAFHALCWSSSASSRGASAWSRGAPSSPAAST